MVIRQDHKHQSRFTAIPAINPDWSLWSMQEEPNVANQNILAVANKISANLMVTSFHIFWLNINKCI